MSNPGGDTHLSLETERRLHLLFAPPHQERARKILLEQCGTNLPFSQVLESAALDRFRFAALKLSGGSLNRLRAAVQLAKTDWRDLLVAALLRISMLTNPGYRSGRGDPLALR